MAATFLSISPNINVRIATNSVFIIEYSGTELDTIQEHYIVFEDVDGNAVKFDVSVVSYDSGTNVSTFSITPEEALSINSYYEITLLTSIKDVGATSITEKTFKLMTRSYQETAVIEEDKTGQVLDTYYKGNLVSDLLDTRDLIIEGEKYNYSYIPSKYDPDSYTYSDIGTSYLVHDNYTFLKSLVKNQYFKGYEQYFDNLLSFDVLSSSDFLDIEKALYPRSIDLAIGSGLKRKIEFLMKLYARASGKHFVLVEPDPHYPFKYYIVTDIPNSAWSGTIKPIVHPIGWQEKYIELDTYYVLYDEWNAQTAYEVGDRIQVEGADNEYWVLECTVAGTSSITTPDWETLIVSIGTIITDTGVTWTVIEELYQIHNYQTELYQWTEEELNEFRDLFYIKGEDRILDAKFITTTTNLDLSDTGYLYFRNETSTIPSRILRTIGSWVIDKVIEDSKIYINGSVNNDGIYDVDAVVNQTVLASDDSSSDNTDDWTVDASASLTFDRNHYKITTTAIDQVIYLSDVEIIEGRTYRIQSSVKNGTTSSDFQFYFNDGSAIQTGSTETTTSTWTTASSDNEVEFIATNSTILGEVGIKILDDLSSNSIQIKDFVCTEMSQIELDDGITLTDEVITIVDSEGTGIYIGFDLNDRSDGMWVDGFIRPDPDTNEEINDPTSDLYNPDAISPNYPSSALNNWAHSVYEQFLDYPQWSYSTYYRVGELIVVNGYILRCTTTGTSGLTEPLWPFKYTADETINDGTVVWTLSDLYNTDGWQARKSYYIGNKILVRGYICEASVAGISGINEPTWPSTFTYEEIVVDNTVSWKVIEELKTTRRDLLNVRNAVKTMPKFPMNYIEALPTAGIIDSSAIIYSSFERSDLAYKDIGSMTEQYDGDPYAIPGREEYSHVTQLKLVRGSGVSSFSNPGEDITFLYTDETSPVVWIESTTFTTQEFSFGNVDLANTPTFTPSVIDTTDLLIDSISVADLLSDGRYYQEIVWNSSVSYSDISGIKTGDSLDLQSAATTIDAVNQGYKTVLSHDHYNNTLKILNTSTGSAQSNIKSDNWLKSSNYDMATFLIPGTFSFDGFLLAGYNKLVFYKRIEPVDWLGIDKFPYNYWEYESNIDYPDDTGADYTTFQTLLEDEDNYKIIKKDNLSSGSSIIYHQYRFTSNDITGDWLDGKMLFEYTDIGAFPCRIDGVLKGCIEHVDDTNGVIILSSVNGTLTTIDDDKYYSIYPRIKKGTILATDTEYTTIGSTFTFHTGHDKRIDCIFNVSDLFHYRWNIFVIDTSTISSPITTNTTLSGDDIIKDLLIIQSGIVTLSGTLSIYNDDSDYFTSVSNIFQDTYSTVTSPISTNTTLSGNNVIFNYLFINPSVTLEIDGTGTLTIFSETNDLSIKPSNRLTGFISQSSSYDIKLDVNGMLWRNDRVLLDTGILTFDDADNSLTRSIGSWLTDTTPVQIGDTLQIKGTLYNDGYHVIKSITSSKLILMRNYVDIFDETIFDLPENTETTLGVIKAWNKIYYTLEPTIFESI